MLKFTVNSLENSRKFLELLVQICLVQFCPLTYFTKQDIYSKDLGENLNMLCNELRPREFSEAYAYRSLLI